jgi:HK97 family phage major capsid protein
MTKLAIPKDATELEEMLNDTERMKPVFADQSAFGEFVRNYAAANMPDQGDIATMIREETATVVADMLRTDRKTARKLDLSPMGARALSRGGKGEVYNKRAPGAKVDESKLFVDHGEFFQAIWHNSASLPNGEELAGKIVDHRKIQNSFGSGVPADGGFLIPETLRSQMLQLSLETSLVRSRATVIPMDSLRVPIPMVDSTTNVGSVYGGIVAYWTEESAPLTESQASFGRVVLDAKKLTAFAVVPNELMADAAAFMGFFDQSFPGALAFFEDLAFIKGSGAGEPLGWLNNPAAIVTAAKSGQGANTLIWENIVGMYSRMLPASLATAVWVASIDTFPQLATMALSVGTGGSAIWLNSGAEGPPMTILGRPVIFTEKTPQLGTTGDISFVDLSYYLIGDRQAMQAASSVDYRFGNDQTAFRVIERVDGRPWLQSAITPANSGPTLSPFVQLSSTRT